MRASVRELSDVTVDPAEWVTAALDLVAVITDGHAGDPFGAVADRVLGVADADLVSVVVRASGNGAADGAVEVAAVAGADARHWRGMSVPARDSFSGAMFEHGRPRLLRDLSDHLGDNVTAISDVQSLLAVPLRSGGTTGSVRAVLTIGRRAGRAAFTETDLALATLFGGQLAMALAHREQSARLERVVLAGERDRIARGMQTHVIAPLFALGIRLQGAAGVTTGVAARQFEAGSDEIDETIKAIRTTVYRLAD